MAVCKIALTLAAIIVMINAQRPFYAGSGAIGYPQLENESVQLSNRFGEDAPLPIQAKGDRNLINRLESVPIDNRPFWYLNWQQYDAMRRQPQTWPQKPNTFIDK
ncbi:uncharacterized protein LOC131851241 [Achroia grisella]|uniref:uncharacterized protein LOC131851241 n=1 Tax=Achroia grisella TaxID=688607 RepID=UPI0027D299E0|nr:uncharacterized protein LOC131851241 [Achroia grisella]